MPHIYSEIPSPSTSLLRAMPLVAVGKSAWCEAQLDLRTLRSEHLNVTAALRHRLDIRGPGGVELWIHGRDRVIWTQYFSKHLKSVISLQIHLHSLTAENLQWLPTAPEIPFGLLDAHADSWPCIIWLPLLSCPFSSNSLVTTRTIHVVFLFCPKTLFFCHLLEELLILQLSVEASPSHQAHLDYHSLCTSPTGSVYPTDVELPDVPVSASSETHVYLIHYGIPGGACYRTDA